MKIFNQKNSRLRIGLIITSVIIFLVLIGVSIFFLGKHFNGKSPIDIRAFNTHELKHNSPNAPNSSRPIQSANTSTVVNKSKTDTPVTLAPRNNSPSPVPACSPSTCSPQINCSSLDADLKRNLSGDAEYQLYMTTKNSLLTPLPLDLALVQPSIDHAYQKYVASMHQAFSDYQTNMVKNGCKATVNAITIKSE